MKSNEVVYGEVTWTAADMILTRNQCEPKGRQPTHWKRGESFFREPCVDEKHTYYGRPTRIILHFLIPKLMQVQPRI